MKSLKFHITTLSPLLVTNNTGDPNMVSTKEYISGTAILGAFAGMYIKKNNLTDAHTDNNFCRWFLNGSLKFSNAYIASNDKGNIKDNLPIPISIQKDKDNESDIYDLLHYDLNELKNSNGEDIATKRIDGFGKIGKTLLYEQKIKKSLNFHHKRDSDTGTTKEIFNYESIDAGQTLEGAIIGEESDLKKIYAFFSNSFETNIGRSRSAQYGKVAFKFVNDEPEDIPVNSATGEISLALLSDTIIYNEQGFSTTNEGDFKKALKDKIGNSVEIKKAFIKNGEIEIFVSVWKLRKPSETCFLMGSCFLISGVDATHIEKLKDLQISGIGERTHEGFGRVAIGIQTDKSLTKRDYGEAPISPGTLPTKTKEIAKEAVKNYIRRTLELKALEECEGFSKNNKNLPSKSLISRLEMAVKTRNCDAFISYLDGLRNTAKDNLKKCHNDTESLFEFLQRKEVKVESNIMNDIQEICNKINEIAFTPANDADFINSLYKSYFETFFSAMRKAKKMEKEG